MKNLYKSLAFAAIAAATLISCNKEPQPVEQPGPKTGATVIEFSAQVADPSTKATLTPNEGDTEFTAAWEGNDELRLAVSNSSASEETIATWDATKSVFSATFQNLSGQNTWTYKAIWPVPSEDGIDFGSERVQNGNAYNSAYDVMSGSKSVTAEIGMESDNETPLVVPMNRLTGIAYFHITGGPEGENVVSAKLEATGIAAETVSVNESGELVVPETKLNEINLTINGDLPADDFALWFNVLPGTYSGLTLTITTDGGKTASLNANNLTYTAGKLNKAVLSGLNWAKETTNSEYSIVFIDKAVNQADITTSVKASTFIEESSCVYVTNYPVSAATKAYYGQSSANPQPVRLGTSSAAGSMTLTLSSTGSVSVSSITVKAKQYSDGKTKKIGVNGSEKQQPGDDYTDLSFNLDGSTISTIKLDTDGYIYVKSLTVFYIEKEPVTLSFGETTEFEITNGDEFTPPALSTDPAGLTVSYTSSNTEVATVNESTGAVSVVGIGSTTITATFAGDNTYSAASASYVLKVNRALSSSIAEIKEDLANGADSFNANITNAIITGKWSSGAYIQDATAGIYVYGSSVVADLTVGDSYSGQISGTMKSYNGQPEITSLVFGEGIQVSHMTTLPLEEVTIAELNSNISDYDGKRVKIIKAKTNGDLGIQSGSQAIISQGSNSLTLLHRTTLQSTIAADSFIDVIGFPMNYKTNSQNKNEIIVTDPNAISPVSITWQLSNIEIATLPKVSYSEGEKFNPSGLVISATWEDVSDNSLTRTETVAYNDDTKDDFEFSPSLETQLNSSNTSVVITYKGKMTEITITVVAAGQESVVYTLTPTSGSNNGYANNCDITISNITWNLTGNSQTNPWRIGGKSLSGVDRTLYSKTALNYNISKIEITHGAASSITVNSMTVIVSKNADFSNPVSTLTPSFEANKTVTITRPSGADWNNCYYKIVYNVTVSSTSNKFIEFTKAEFTGK